MLPSASRAYVSPRLEQGPYDVDVAAVAGSVQRGVTIVILGLDFGASLEQGPHHTLHI